MQSAAPSSTGSIPLEQTTPWRIYDLATQKADYACWEGRPLRSVIVCTHMRSGSTLLGEAMYVTGRLGCPIEYFHRGFQPYLATRWQTSTFQSYLDSVYRLRTDPSGTLGVKLFWRDVEELCFQRWPDEEDRLREALAQNTAPSVYTRIYKLLGSYFPNPRFVYLYRRDRLRQAISLLKATQTRNFRLIPGVTEAPSLLPEYDYDRILLYLGIGDYCHLHWEEFFRSTGIVPYRISYEDFVRDFSTTVSGLFEFLGVRDVAVITPRLHRQADQLSEEFLARFLRDYQARNSCSSML
jgi:trehalose 2-sulfotransferase